MDLAQLRDWVLVLSASAALLVVGAGISLAVRETTPEQIRLLLQSLRGPS